jgi:hypothetical protein
MLHNFLTLIYTFSMKYQSLQPLYSIVDLVVSRRAKQR